MKKSTIITITVLVILVLAVGGYFMNGHSQKETLKTALNLNSLPTSLKILEYNDQGVSTFRAEYYLSIDPVQFDELIKGRKYDVGPASNDEFIRYATTSPGKDFVPVVLCRWGTEKERAIIYTNISKSLVYVIWDAN